MRAEAFGEVRTNFSRARKFMELVNELGNDVALAILVEKRHSGKIDSGEILPLISKIREILEPVSTKDHSYNFDHPDFANAMRTTN